MIYSLPTLLSYIPEHVLSSIGKPITTEGHV